ncbi:MAG: thrombospondin type 3 repeat-containing protein [Candidatus Komeilibacteria bacterium]
MASRNYLILAVLGLSLIGSVVLAQTESLQPTDAPVETVDATSAPVDITADSPLIFFIESDDQDTYSGKISFIVRSYQPIEVPLAVFIYAGDKTLVKTVNLQASPDARRWQANFDTSGLANGRYHFTVGYRLLRGAEPIIWDEGYWAAVVNSRAAIPVEPLPIKSEFTPTAEIPATNLPPVKPAPAIVVASSTPVAINDEQITDFCARHSLTTAEACQAVESFRLNPVCRQQQIAATAECQQYLLQMYQQPLCQNVSATDADSCSNYLLQQAQERKICGDWPALACATSIGSAYQGELASYLAISDTLELALRPLLQQTIDWKTLLQRIDSSQLLDQVRPVNIGDNNPLVRLLPLKAGAVIDANQDWQMVWSAGIQFDGDGDGLSDEAEIRYGTKLDAVDSDNDGYLDGEELQHHYNPAGTGKLPGALAGIDQALINGLSIEQPWTYGVSGDKVTISQVSAFIAGSGLHFHGTGPVLQPVSLFIGQPLPLVVTVMSDKNGQWDYYLNRELRDNEYTIYAVLINDQGIITAKSQPTTIYWQQEQLVTLQQIADGQLIVKGVAYDRFGVTTPLAIGLIAAALIIGGTLLVVSWRRW